jgi:hypothetical protein
MPVRSRGDCRSVVLGHRVPFKLFCSAPYYTPFCQRLSLSLLAMLAGIATLVAFPALALGMCSDEFLLVVAALHLPL